MVDVLQEGGEVIVVTELPGVEKDDIKLESTDRALKIAVESAKRRYFKELELPLPSWSTDRYSHVQERCSRS